MKAIQLIVRVLITAAIVALALVVGWYLWDYYMNEPWTRDGRVRAEVVEIAPDVSGTVTGVHVADNQAVRAGEPLFTIDASRFRLAVDQAEALVQSRLAALQLARRESERSHSLSSSAVSVAQQERTESELRIAAASHQQAMADLEVARLNLERTTVRAPVDGFVTNLQLDAGDYAAAGQPVVALVDRNSFHVIGYFEETRLPRIQVGDRVQVQLMSGGPALAGRVDSIASGIVDREQTSTTGLLANVNPTFNWVRLAQRIPVRVTLDRIPEGVRLVNGLTATVRIEPAEPAQERAE